MYIFGGQIELKVTLKMSPVKQKEDIFASEFLKGKTKPSTDIESKVAPPVGLVARAEKSCIVAPPILLILVFSIFLQGTGKNLLKMSLKSFFFKLQFFSILAIHSERHCLSGGN